MNRPPSRTRFGGTSLAVFAVLLRAGDGRSVSRAARMREAPPLPRVYATLARLPQGPVIELPYWSENVAYHRHAEYMLLSTAHWQPLVNGYSDHIPQDFRDNALPLSGFPSRDVVRDPREARRPVCGVPPRPDGRRARASLVARLENDYANYLRPLEKDGDVWLYEIIAWPR